MKAPQQSTNKDLKVQKKHNVLSKMPPRSPVGSQTAISDATDSNAGQQQAAPASPPQNSGVPVSPSRSILILDS